jgi:competence protein ComEC
VVKRPLVPVVVALMTGIAAGAWGVRLSPGSLGLLLIVLLVDLGVLWWARRRTFFLPLLVFVLVGSGLYHLALEPPFPPHHLVWLPLDADISLKGRLFRPSRVGGDQTRLFLEVEAVREPQGWRHAGGRLLVSAPPFTPPPVGSRLVVRGKLRDIRNLNNPGAFDRRRQLAMEGIFRQLRVEDMAPLVVLAEPEGVSLTERLRGGIREHLQTLNAVPRAFYLAMLLGDQGEVTPAMRGNLSLTGTSHLLAINGLHLGAVAAVTFFLVFGVLRCVPWLLLRLNALRVATLAAALPVVLYAHLAGGSPATQRAEIMVLAYLLLMVLGRPRELWSALALAALVIVLLNPLRLFSPSFQLSFAAVAGLLYFVPLVTASATRGQDRAPGPRGLRARLGRRLKETLAVSLVAAVVTAPLVAYHFQVVSLLGWVVNLAAIPLILFLALPLGELAVLAQGVGLSGAAGWLLWLGSIALNLGYEAIVRVAALPGSGLTVSTPTFWQVALCYALLGLLFPLRRTWWTWAGAGGAAAVLAGSVLLPSYLPAKGLEITVLDSNVGLEGVMVAPGGRRLAFSGARPLWPGQAGGGGGALPDYLHYRQFRRLDAVLALPVNRRNASSLLSLAKEFQVGGFWWRQERQPEGPMLELVNFLGDAGRPALSLDRGRPPRHLGDAVLAYLSWEGGQAWALEVTYRGQRVLILPPLRPAVLRKFPGSHPDRPLAALVAPAEAPAELLQRLHPQRLVLYGEAPPETTDAPLAPTWLTRLGTVSLALGPDGLTLTQWTP